MSTPAAPPIPLMLLFWLLLGPAYEAPHPLLPVPEALAPALLLLGPPNELPHAPPLLPGPALSCGTAITASSKSKLLLPEDLRECCREEARLGGSPWPLAAPAGEGAGPDVARSMAST